jgi:hypothetical protein
MVDWEKIVLWIGVVSFLMVLTTIILMMVGTFKMHEAVVRGKAMREKCGTEYYEAETIRYQVYEKWEQEVKKIFDVSAWLTIFVILVVLGLYIFVIGVDTKDIMKPHWFWGMMAFLFVAFLIYATIGTFLLLPSSGVKLYGEMDESSLTKRLIGSIVMITFIVSLPLILFAFPQTRKDSNTSWTAIFGNHPTFYKGGWTIIRLVVVVAFINLIYALMIKDSIYQKYYNPTEPNQLSTGQINEVIKKAIITVNSNVASVASEKADRDKKIIYSSNDYFLYKKIYQGINELDAPENGVDEGSLKDTTATIYQPYFKYLKHSSDVDVILDEIDKTTDTKSKFKGLNNIDEKVSKPIDRIFNLTLSILITLTIIPFYLFFHANYQKSGFLLKIGGVVLLLMLFSFFYVMMTQSLIS